MSEEHDHSEAAASILAGGETPLVSALKPILTLIAARQWPKTIADEIKEAASALGVQWGESAVESKIALLEAILRHENPKDASTASGLAPNALDEIQNVFRRVKADVREMLESVIGLVDDKLAPLHAEIDALKAKVAELEKAKVEAAAVEEPKKSDEPKTDAPAGK